MDKQEAIAKLAQLVSDFEKALSAAEDFANEHELNFDISPSYGMGGTYNGYPSHRWLEEGWNPSSMSC